MIILRAATAIDIPFVYDCLCDLEKMTLDRTAFERIFLANLNNAAVNCIVAEADTIPVGFLNCYVQLLLHHAGPVGEIQEMYVLPNWRSKGVGQQLVEHLLGIARHEKWVNLEVTSNRRRQRTHEFYERMGFVNTHVKLVVGLIGD